MGISRCWTKDVRNLCCRIEDDLAACRRGHCKAAAGFHWHGNQPLLDEPGLDDVSGIGERCRGAFWVRVKWPMERLVGLQVAVGHGLAVDGILQIDHSRKWCVIDHDLFDCVGDAITI